MLESSAVSHFINEEILFEQVTAETALRIREDKRNIFYTSLEIAAQTRKKAFLHVITFLVPEGSINPIKGNRSASNFQ